MNEIPSLWRTELWHPLLVHLPIVTLLLATLAGLLKLIMGNPARKLFLSQFIIVMLFLGIAGGWAGIYTGQLAYNIEVRKICDPKILQEHQWYSYAAMITYTVALLLIVCRQWLKPGVAKMVNAAVTLLLLAGGCALLYSGHLGASVVYQQGAGTYKPSENCEEFVR